MKTTAKLTVPVLAQTRAALVDMLQRSRNGQVISIREPKLINIFLALVDAKLAEHDVKGDLPGDNLLRIPGVTRPALTALHHAQISTYKALAELNEDQLMEILSAGGVVIPEDVSVIITAAIHLAEEP